VTDVHFAVRSLNWQQEYSAKLDLNSLQRKMLTKFETKSARVKGM
jgi:hypothetical protein